MTSIGGYSSPFAISGDLGVGTATILGGNAGGEQNAATLLQSGTVQSGPLGAIAASLNTSVSPTVDALRTGKLTTSQHKVLQALYASGTTPLSIPWTASGKEPTTIATIRSYGWIKLVKPTALAGSKQVASATYELTPVGKAIAKRTGGAGGVTTSGISLST
jgi:hypothetical protein